MTRLRGGGLQSDKELGYLVADSDGALPRAEARVLVVAAEERAGAASERAADARAEAAAAGDGAGASARATASRVKGRGALGVTFGAAAAAAGGSGGPPRCGLLLPGISQGLGSGGGFLVPGGGGGGPGGGGGGPVGGGGPAPGGGGGGPAGGGPRAPPGRGGLDIRAIIAATAVAAAAAQGYAAFPLPPSAVRGGECGLTPVKLLHLRFVCGVATDAEVPPIWRKVAQAPTKGAVLSILNQYL